MYRLLIVDDLPIIVDGLLELFQGQERLELEVMKAYSGEEALELLNRHRVDIVLSDIKMPGIEGIQLLKEIGARWPSCKVIFLTGYNDFQYARDAVTYGGFDYILKVESDNKIIDAVERAMVKLDEELDRERIVTKAQSSMRRALPSLQKEYMLGLLQGRTATRSGLERLFREMDIPLDPEEPVYLLIGRVDGWKEMMSAPDKALLTSAFQNIGDEYLARGARYYSAPFEFAKIVWLIQPLVETAGVEDDSAANGSGGKISCLGHAAGVLESIQATCKELLGMSVSFALGAEPVEWDGVAERFYAVKYELAQGQGLLHEAILIEREGSVPAEGFVGKTTDVSDGFYHARVQMLAGCLENGQREPFYKLYAELTSIWNESGASNERKTELYHSLSAVFLFHLQRNRDVCDYANTQLDLAPLFGRGDALPWPELILYYQQLADCCFEWNELNGAVIPSEVVNKVHQYIEKHIATDISLNALADCVGLNPSYLSRLYKQNTGIGLSKYINDYRNMTARDMLLNTSMKVNEIAGALGYNSALAFIRFFKKQNGATPLEFRSSRSQPSGHGQ
ncbi:DNA-binding response regulator [Paenibacillus sp. MY03]|uniref:response regulator transcription factor n=1 Tax=Paenibacillus sp. MY03 TaxID=302980 RepID=UPI000B3CFE44|nr:response regulator [Paenibacillus sp. MY03]OUS77130.1 DNA-binding response regulator [Paenibacillus sp. MY03]